MVTIGHAFNGLEPFDGSGVVELVFDFLSQGQVSNVETSILSVLLPILPAVSLDFLLRPVPSILRFNSLDFTVDFQKSDGVTTSGTSTPLNDLIETIHSGNDEEITRANFSLIQVDEGVFSLDPKVTSTLLDEQGVKELHPPGGLGTEDGNIRVKTETTSEETESDNEVGKDVSKLVAGLEDSQTERLDGLEIVSLQVL